AQVAASGFRAAPHAHSTRLNLERTETHKQNGTAYKQTVAYDKAGLPLKLRTYESGVTVPPTGNLPSGETQGEDRDVYSFNDDVYSRGRSKSAKRGDPQNVTS